MGAVFSRSDDLHLLPKTVDDFNKAVLVSNLPNNLPEYNIWVHLGVCPNRDVVKTRMYTDNFCDIICHGLVFYKRSEMAKGLAERLKNRVYENRTLDTVYLKDQLQEIRQLEHDVMRKQEEYIPECHAKSIDVTLSGLIQNRGRFLSKNFRKYGTIREIEERSNSVLRVTFSFYSEAYTTFLMFNEETVDGVYLKVKLPIKPNVMITLLKERV